MPSHRLPASYLKDSLKKHARAAAEATRLARNVLPFSPSGTSPQPSLFPESVLCQLATLVAMEPSFQSGQLHESRGSGDAKQTLPIFFIKKT